MTDLQRAWHRLVDWEIAVKDAAVDLAASQSCYGEAVRGLKLAIAEVEVIVNRRGAELDQQLVVNQSETDPHGASPLRERQA